MYKGNTMKEEIKDLVTKRSETLFRLKSCTKDLKLIHDEQVA